MEASHPEIDETLLQRVREGDDQAWRELITLLNPQVTAIIRNQIRNPNDHEDLSQDAFTKIFLKLHQYAGRQPFRHWVSRLTINTCYDYLRHHRARPLIRYSDLSETEASILENHFSGKSTQPENSLNEMRSLLDRLIATLKPREQIIIRLLDLEENSVQTVCELTGWGASRVKVTAMRARRKLKETLKRLERPH